jgi:copper chaperone CopZ
MVVTSHIEGRVRIRDEGLKKEALLSEVRNALEASPGIAAVEANPRVGSLLVFYDAAVTGMEKISEIIAEFFGEVEPAAEGKLESFTRVLRKIPRTIPERAKRIAVNAGMLGSLVLSIAAAIIDLKKLHILAGVIFLAFFGFHVFERKEFLFA